MNCAKQLRMAFTCFAIAGVAIAGTAEGGSFDFKVALHDTPGVQQISAGKFDDAARILRKELRKAEGELRGEILVNLCASYVLAGKLDKAAGICDEAVQETNAEPAYNNRGVYRAHAGDLEGAREDFAQVRPDDVDAYIANYWVTDAKLMASRNYQLVSELAASYTSHQVRESGNLSVLEPEFPATDE